MRRVKEIACSHCRANCGPGTLDEARSGLRLCAACAEIGMELGRALSKAKPLPGPESDGSIQVKDGHG